MGNHPYLQIHDWIHAFRESGLSRKDWCQQNKIPLSTLSYWIRKSQPEAPKAERTSNLMFAKLPSEQELQFHTGTENHSVTILLPENIRIEIDADCSAPGFEGLCLIFPEVRRFIWHAGLQIFAKVTPVCPQSSN